MQELEVPKGNPTKKLFAQDFFASTETLPGSVRGSVAFSGF